MAQHKKSTKKTSKRPTDAETLGKLVDRYEQVFGEVDHFVELIARQESEIAAAQTAMFDAKEKYERLRDEFNQAREARDGTKHSLFMFLKPGPSEIMPLFDRMEPADEEKHGAHSDEWRKEPVAALRLSLIATNLLASADVLFVGQLQDRIQEKPANWFEAVDGLTAPMAAAIADKLNDFIAERSGK